MRFKEKNIRKYLHDLTVDQLEDDYLANGWKISREEKIGGFAADLVVRKQNKTIVFEVKVGNVAGRKNEEIEKLSEEIKKLGYEFRLVIPSPPKQREIEFIGLEQLLMDEMINDFPSELDELSSDTTIEEVSDIEIEELIISNTNDISVKGSGVVSVSLSYGGVDGSVSDDSYPFDFDVVVSSDGKSFTLLEAGQIKVDTSSFYQ